MTAAVFQAEESVPRSSELQAAYALTYKVKQLTTLFNKYYPTYKHSIGPHEMMDFYNEFITKAGVNPVELERAHELVAADRRAQLMDYMVRKAAGSPVEELVTEDCNG